MVFDAVSRHESRVLSLETFREHLRAAGTAPGPQTPVKDEDGPSPFAAWRSLPTISDAVDLLVDEALRRTRGNITQAAEILGVTRQALSKRLKKAG